MVLYVTSAVGTRGRPVNTNPNQQYLAVSGAKANLVGLVRCRGSGAVYIVLLLIVSIVFALMVFLIAPLSTWVDLH